MDTRWWILNVWFALLPAAILTLYCELRGKHLMYEYHHQLEVNQIRQLLGDDEFTIERANRIIAARDRERKEAESTGWNGDLDEMAWKFLQTCLWTMYTTGAEILTQLWNEYYPKNNESSSNSDTMDGERNGITTNHQEATMQSGSNPFESSTPLPDVQSTHDQIPMVVPSVSDRDVPLPFPSPSPPTTTTGRSPRTFSNSDAVGVDPSIEYLLQRVQQMEERLRQQEHEKGQQQPPPPWSPSALRNKDPESTDHDEMPRNNDDDARAIRIIGERMQQMNQSDVQNRFEIEAKQKWQKYMTETMHNEEGAKDNTNGPHKNSNNDLTHSSSSSPTGAQSSSSSSVTESIESFFSLYGTQLVQELQQRIGWSDNHNESTDVSLSNDDPPSTKEKEDSATSSFPQSGATDLIPNDATPNRPNRVDVPHEVSNAQSSCSTPDSDTPNVLLASSDPPLKPRHPWWKFF